MKLYGYWRSSSSYRVRIALNHKGVAWENVPVNLLAGAQHGAAHSARNPLHTVPLLEVQENGAPVYLSQSVAIAEYLEECFPTPPLFPKPPVARAQMRAMAEQVNSGIQPFQNLGTMNHVKDVLQGDAKAWAVHWVTKGLGQLEAMAAPVAGAFLVGDALTWADCCLVPQLYSARRFGIALDAFPALLRAEASCNALDAVRRAAPDQQPDATP